MIFSVAGVAGVAVAILLIFVIPTVQQMFASAGIPLPLPTRIVIGMSAFLQAFWWLVIVGIIAAAFLLRAIAANPTGRLMLDRILLNMPVLGDLQRKAAVARFTRILGTLVSSGVSISSRGSRSPPRPPATASSTTRSWARAPRSPGARRSPVHSRSRGCSRPWSCK